jgi:hypothetical protein
MADPLMAVVRVKVPTQVDPHVLAAALTRAICTCPMTAELTVLPSWRRPKKGLRKYAFVAVLRTSAADCAADLVGVAETALREAVRREFGASASASVRPVRSDVEVDAYWCSVRGTPHRP